MNFQNGVCEDMKGNNITFNQIASFYSAKEPRLFIKYNAYRDWRDRGLVSKRIVDVEDIKGKSEKGKNILPRILKKSK